MTALTDHFGGEVFWCSAIGHPLTVLIEEIGPAEVSKFDRVLCVEQDVLRLDVSVDDWRVLVVQVLDCFNYFSDELSGDALREATLALEPGVDLALRCEFKDQVEGIIIFIVIEELDDVLVVKLVHDLYF